MRQLTPEEVLVLEQFKNVPDGDLKFWDKIAEFYADDTEALKRIEFERKFLLSVRMIALGFGSFDKTRQEYLDSVDEFLSAVGYPIAKKEAAEPAENILEKIFAAVGIDVDVDGDGVTSFQHYKK